MLTLAQVHFFWVYNVEETPPMRVARKICILGAISLNKIFIKICSHPIISWFFCDPPLFLMKKFYNPQLFHDPPPHSEENDSPVSITQAAKIVKYQVFSLL